MPLAFMQEDFLVVIIMIETVILFSVITACVHSMTEGYSFTLLVCSQGGSGPAGGGQVQLPRGVSPARGVRHRGGLAGRSATGGGQPPGGFRSRRGGQVQLGGVWGGSARQDNIGSTCYTAGGMPLAFMQEDFLVVINYDRDSDIIFCYYRLRT